MSLFVRILVIGAVALGSTVALAACGSSTKPHAANAAYTSGLKLAGCMRARGVPTFPDPDSHGSINLTPASGIDPQSPSFQSAQRACAKYAPDKFGPPEMSPGQRRQALRFAQCMRANGQSNFPDPSLSPLQNTGVILALRGMFFSLQPGVDPKSPAFQHAVRACGVSPP